MSDQGDQKRDAGAQDQNPADSGSGTAGAIEKRPDSWRWSEAGTPGSAEAVGKRPRVGGAMPRTTSDVGSHSTPPSVFRTPEDQVPVNWNTRVPLMPADGFEVINVVPPKDCPMPENAVMEGSAAHHKAKLSARDPNAGGDRAILMTHANSVLRQTWWDEYAKQAGYVQAMQSGVAPDVARCENVRRDGHLRALGFVIPEGFRGGVAELANQQLVPDRGSGLRLGQLFSADQMQAMTAPESSTLDRMSKSSSVDGALRRTNASDSGLRAALERVQAAAAGAKAAAHELKSTLAGRDEDDA